MKINRVTWSHRNDFNALMTCEHCGHEQEDQGLYNDAFYHERVIPARHYCKGCGKNRLGETRPALHAPPSGQPLPDGRETCKQDETETGLETK